MESDALTTQLMTPISANLRRLRGAANLTQQALATGGLSVSIVCQIEQGVTWSDAAARYPPSPGC